MVKILVVGDLHGVKPRIHFKDFDAIVQPGDFCSDKLLRPAWKKYFKMLKRVGVNEAPAWEAFAESIFGKNGLEIVEQKQMEKGREVLEYLNSFGKPVFLVPGNWDNSYGPTRIKDMDKSDYNYDRTWIDWWSGKKINSFLTKGLSNIKDCQFALHEFMGINFIGYGNSSGPEKFEERLKKGDYSKAEKLKLKVKIKELYSSLEKLFRKGKKSPVIFISHNVPNGVMDKIQNKNNHANGRNAGSTVAREMIEKFNPLLCIGGHIHEYHGKKKLGKTTVVNAGYGRNVNTLIEINEKTGKIKKIEFWDGGKK